MSDNQTLQTLIEAAFEKRAELSPKSISRELSEALETTIGLLDSGKVRVAEKKDGEWIVNQWLKKAVLLYFRARENTVIDAGYSKFYDKVPLKYAGYAAAEFRDDAARVVPHAVVRRGAYVGPNAVLMPSYVNIGAYVASGAMVDTWVTVGSCAQIGANVHISGGAGIGGVLEPMQATPTIIEDNCFIGARSEVAEGVIVGEGSVLAMGTFLSMSTKIVDRYTGEIVLGKVPPYSVVVPGSLGGGEGKPALSCAVIIKRVDERTRSKTSINELLRD
jgi:2,3,4,5-tetrahydropyridine-2-carboxylate N-succinyltransferase